MSKESKDFGTTLSDALELVAQAARTAGAPAAQTRGRKREMHKRIAIATTTSLAIVVVGVTAAFAVTGSNNGGATQKTAVRRAPPARRARPIR